jgi:hypothetical protein
MNVDCCQLEMYNLKLTERGVGTYRHRQALLVNTLYSLSARHIELRHAEGLPADVAQVTALIQYLQSLRGRRLWPNEDPALSRPHPPSADALASLVDQLLGALVFEPGLRGDWCEVALEWALHCRSRHSASRSQQVLRALAPPLTADFCSTLLRCMLQCLGPAAQVRPDGGREPFACVLPACM